MPWRISCMVGVALLTALWACPSAAQDYKAEAKKHYQQGVALYDEGNYEAALAEFQASYKANPNFRVLMNISACNKSLYRYAAAADALEQYLEAGGSKVKGKERADIRAAIEELKSLLAHITIEVNQAGAMISVDDAEKGTHPLGAPMLMDPGEHKITAALSGYLTAERKITVVGGQAQTVSLVLEKEKKEGQVLIRTGQEGAVIKVDGEAKGTGTWEGNLLEGGHVLEVVADGMKPYRSELVIAANQKREIQVDLLPLVEKSKVRVEASIDGASVFIDGENMGFAPWEGDLTVGGHQLEVLHDDKAPFRTEVTIMPGQSRTVVARLEEKTSAIGVVEKDHSGLYWGLGIAGGAIVAGGLTVLGLWLGGILWPDAEAPVDGNLPPGSYQL